MGTLERIRQTSPYALALFAIIFIGFMVASDADFSTLMHRGKNYKTDPVAIINGENVLYSEFNAKVQKRIEQQQSSAKDNPDFVVDEKQIRADIWKETIEQTLLKQEAKKAGIFVADGEILDVMLENPPEFLKKTFTDSTGKFNKNVYLDIVTNPDKLRNYMPPSMPAEQIQSQIDNFKKDLINIEIYLREQKLSESTKTFVNTAETILSPNFVKERYVAENSSTSVDYIFFDVNSIPDMTVTVSEDDIKAYYNEVKQYYKQKPLRRLKYVRYTLHPSNDDTTRAIRRVANIDKSLQSATNVQSQDSIFDVKMIEYGGETSDFVMAADVDKRKMVYLDTLKKLQVVGPINLMPDGVFFFRLDDKRSGKNEQIKASHILIKANNNPDSAKKEALKILKMAKSGEDFANLAIKYSEDKGSGRKGGDLGYFGKGKMVKEFDQAVFAAKPGQIIGPVKTQFGYHIIKVVDRISEEIKFSEIQIKPTLSTATKNKLFRKAFSLQRQASEGVSFDTLVARLNLIPTLTSYVTEMQPMLGSNYMTHLAFANNVGTVLEPLELKQYGIVVAQVSDGRPGGLMDYNDLKAQLKDELVHRKKLDLIEKKANDFYSTLSGITELKNVMQADSTIKVKSITSYKKDNNIPGIGIDYGFAENAFNLPTGKISKPVRGSRGYYIMQIYNRQKADDSNPAAIYSFKTQLLRKIQQRAFYSWFSKIVDKAEIQDFRSDFYQDY